MFSGPSPQWSVPARPAAAVPVWCHQSAASDSPVGRLARAFLSCPRHAAVAFGFWGRFFVCARQKAEDL